MVGGSLSISEERHNQRYNPHGKEHFDNNIYNLFNKEVLMIQIGLWFAGFMLGLGIGGRIGQYIERKDWDQLIRDGKLPRPDQRWNEVGQEKSYK